MRAIDVSYEQVVKLKKYRKKRGEFKAPKKIKVVFAFFGVLGSS
jgi:hypothetical protein